MYLAGTIRVVVEDRVQFLLFFFIPKNKKSYLKSGNFRIARKFKKLYENFLLDKIFSK